MSSESWLNVPKGSHFSLANIHFGIITTPDSADPHAAIAIGDHVLDLYLFAQHGGFAPLEEFSLSHVSLCSQSTLNDFAAAGQSFHRRVREYLRTVFAADTTVPQVLKNNEETQNISLFRKEAVSVHLPMKIGGYTDFFAGKNQAYNCGCIFRDPAKALQPNYLHLPVGYSSRASSVVASGTTIRRPLGQYISMAGDTKSTFGPCQRLDIELDSGALLCKANKMGEPIGVDEAEEYIFGFVLLNDWSVRDIQAWEAFPLGPFNSKNFASTISPWVVLKDALEPYHTPGILNETELHAYLQEKRKDNVYDINLEVDIKTADGKVATFTRTTGKNLVFSFAQMLAHHTIGGCPMQVGDLIGSETISGIDRGSFGSFLEGSNGGKEKFELPNGITRTFLEDGDSTTIRGWCGMDESSFRFVVANSFDSVKELWVRNQSSLISRPTLHTFHNVLSSSQGFTIGTSPWDEPCKKRRKAAATALNRPAVVSYMPFVDLEPYTSIKELVEQIGEQKGQVDLDPYPLFQRLALNLSSTLGYGFRIDGLAEDHLLRKIIRVQRAISTLRSTSNNWQDFVPILRVFPKRNGEAAQLRERRDKYLEFLFQRLKQRIASGNDRPCITGNILKDPGYKPNHEEIKSICLTMIAGGLDTTPTCILLGLAILSGPQGKGLQEKMRDEINKIYPDSDAWGKCLKEEKVEYVSAFCKEVLRFWTVIPMSLPGVSVKDITYQGARIPAGTIFLMNAWAANVDSEHFESPHEFSPERFLNIPEGSGTQHFAFGAGSRMCTGSHLANREMYISFVRVLLAFDVLPVQDPARRPVLTGPLECNANPSGLSIEPKDFAIGLKIRDRCQTPRVAQPY
ncbi:Fc.00g056520.m01.CDS01 [Cosmosporella sp. VM-42]